MNYDINPLNSNLVFSVGQPIIIILFVFTAIAALLTFIGKSANLVGLEVFASKWLSRFAATFLYFILIWASLTMIISYAGSYAFDVVVGVILLAGVIFSLVKRATSDQVGANRALFFMYGLLIAALVWHFIFLAINTGAPSEGTEIITDNFVPHFYSDLFRYFGWA